MAGPKPSRDTPSPQTATNVAADTEPDAEPGINSAAVQERSGADSEDESALTESTRTGPEGVPESSADSSESDISPGSESSIEGPAAEEADTSGPRHSDESDEPDESDGSADSESSGESLEDSLFGRVRHGDSEGDDSADSQDSQVEEQPPTAAGTRRVTRSVAVAGALLSAVLALAIGFAIGVFAVNPDHPGDDSPEAGFARDMAIHHGQAVEMSMIAYHDGSLADVQSLAYDIALTQQAQIGIMHTWLRTWEVPLTGSQPAMAWMPAGMNELRADGQMPGMATKEELEELRQAQGVDVDVLFCQLMIRHHIAGVHMAQEILELTEQPEVRELAQQMVDGQQQEIDVMRGYLDQLGAPLE